MKIIVTGAAGFIGSHLCEKLIKDGHRVLGIDDLSSGSLSNLEGLNSNPSFSFIGWDIRKPIHVGEDFDWFFHLAGKADIVPSIEDPELYHDVNVTGTVKMLELARKLNAKRFIYAASSSCYGVPLVYPTNEILTKIDPQYPYALTKYLGEQYVFHWAKVYGLSAMSLRLFNVYGPRSRTSGAYGAVFGVFLSQLANKSPLTVVGDGEQKRDFTYVTDVVDAFTRVASSEGSGLAVNIGSGSPESINQLVNLLGATDVDYLPSRPGEPSVTWADNRLARDLFGWEPKVSFEEGVEIMKSLIPLYNDAPLWTKESIAKATESWFRYLK